MWVVVLLVALALVFDFMDGFHDAANSIATVVSAGALRPFHAGAFAACFNVLAIAVFASKVAATVGKSVFEPGVADQQVVFGALIGVIIRWYAFPSASSHALIGGIVGATLAIGLGTLFGGWRIVKTMGQRITKLKPVGGFWAETGGAISLITASALGAPVSTTQTITGAICGVGSVRNPAAVRWGQAGNILMAWIPTILACALIAALFCVLSAWPF
jgi:PiT family inorganic phosphate transporter